MPSVRFSRDSVKSPQVPNITIVRASPIHTPNVMKGKKCAMIIAAMMLNAPPPMDPSHDFLGEILSKRRCFPNNIPVQ